MTEAIIEGSVYNKNESLNKILERQNLLIEEQNEILLEICKALKRGL